MKSRLAHTFRGNWIGVKFYKKRPDRSSAEIGDAVRFCEATRIAGIGPVLLDKTNTTCPGARYVFGWDQDFCDYIKMDCLVRYDLLTNRYKKLISWLPRLEESIECIGLNTDDKPDIYISYILPKDMMGIIRKHNIMTGFCMDTTLCSMASICGGIAVKTYLEQNITISFGCDDSRKYAQIDRGRIAVGIPEILIDEYLKDNRTLFK